MDTETEVSRWDIAEGFRDLGMAEGDILLLHSSLSRFGHVQGGADTVIDGILEAVGSTGTLLAPTLTGSEELSPENAPHIDLRSQPCWTGQVAEALRQRAGAVRSTHPTHSCAAIGARARELTQDHHRSPTPCGITSPYYRLAAAQGYIALAGCGLDTCTTFHTVEELANVPYHLQTKTTFGTCIDDNGDRVETPCRLHSYLGPKRDFRILEPQLLERGFMRTALIGQSMVRLVDAMGLIETALDALRFDPFYLTILRGTQVPKT